MKRYFAFLLALLFYASILPWHIEAAPPNARFHNITSDNGAITGFSTIGSPDFTDNLTLYGNDIVFPTGPLDSIYKYPAPNTGTKFLRDDGSWTTITIDNSLDTSSFATLPVTGVQIDNGTLNLNNFPKTIRPIKAVATLPTCGDTTMPEGSVVYLTTDYKLYRCAIDNAWKSTVDNTDISGLISNAMISGLAASKVTGTLTDTQIADLAAAKITGSITSTQITDNAVTTAKINAGAVSTAKLAAGAVTANEIGAYAVTAGKIYAGAIRSADIAADNITSTHLAAGAVTAGKIAANAITSNEISANSIVSGKIAAGAITASHLSADNVIMNSAQIGALVVGTSNIAAGAITNIAFVSGTSGDPPTHLHFDNTYTSVLSTSITTTGSPVIIQFSGYYRAAITSVTIAAFVDNSAHPAIVDDSPSVDSNRIVSFNWRDTLSAGTHSIEIRMMHSGVNDTKHLLQYGTLLVMEVKK